MKPTLEEINARRAALGLPPRPPRGFAALSLEQRKALGAKGGRRSHETGVAHRWNSETAAAAGRKGGKVVAVNRHHMRRIGEKGKASQARQREESA